ncbi:MULTISPECIES: hypothetical protein [Paenibacillus]|uniref:Uncharacterized protein n=1 Tax=Paenibacillus campinasensis TaxID=66347 RepID=A0A268EE60_9BACL|nr:MULTISPECIES: hypothetical protein [Paenibacillus]PAD71408.1 hypothetical protein CHH67_24480 [Paenibacillus campinasensis]PAK48024.1 hypothetical protein CHH75_23505 [Paenibacillus sp. 7541]
MSDIDKLSAYKALVSKRKKCTICDPAQCELKNPSLQQNDKLKTSQIGHWTEWQGSLDAKIMVVGQDWGDFITLVDQDGETNVEESATNRHWSNY